ncbi:MAG TPA: matrixin family metalloprotease [Polyangia bacterium]|nr:matrixin family metalloprotease [Polyangia bacterium]
MVRALFVCGLLSLLSSRAGAWDVERVLKASGILPHQRVAEVRIDASAPSTRLDNARVAAVIAHAVATWNKELPRDELQLVMKPWTAPLKRREVVIVCRFDADASHFKGAGVDEYAYTETAVTRAQELVTFITFNDSEAFYRSAGFHFDGERSSIDFELVALHELGHALGLPHEGSGKVPPLMAPGIDWNATMGEVARLRVVTPADRKLLDRMVHRRKPGRLAGQYTCELASASGHTDRLALTITVAEEIVLEHKDWRVAVPVEALLSWPIEFPAAELKRASAYQAFKLVLDEHDELRAIAELARVRDRRMCLMTRQ